MSLEAMNWALYDVELSDDVDHLAKLLLIYIADQADRDGMNAIVSRGELARMTGISDGAVGNRLRRLRAAGLIEPGDPTVVAHLRYRPAVWDLRLPVNRKILARPPKERRPARHAALGGWHEAGTRPARGRHTGADTPNTLNTPNTSARAAQPAQSARAADDTRAIKRVPADQVPEWTKARNKLREAN